MTEAAQGQGPPPGGPCLLEVRGLVARYGIWERGGSEEPEPERVLATVLFTDIIGSTARAAELATGAGAKHRS